MMRELVWIIFAALVLFTPAADANHTSRHNARYCDGLVTMAEHIAFLKQFDATKLDVMEYIAAVGHAYAQPPATIATWQEDAAAIYDAADGGKGHIETCYERATKPNPVGG